MKKIYRIIAEVELYIAADSQSDAEDEADTILTIEDAGSQPTYVTTEVKSLEEVSAEWKDAYPYRGEEPEQTLMDRFAPKS